MNEVRGTWSEEAEHREGRLVRMAVGSLSWKAVAKCWEGECRSKFEGK